MREGSSVTNINHPRERAEEDMSLERVRQISPSIVRMPGRSRSCPRRLRVTYEPLDLSEIAVEYTNTQRGVPARDPRNRVLLLEEEDLLWLADALGELAAQIRARAPDSTPPISSVQSVRSAYGASSLGHVLSELPSTRADHA